MARRTDREAIHELKYEYHRALDADETDALLAVFTDDAPILHDGAAAPLEGIEEYEQWCVDVTSGRFRSTHLAANPIIAVDGDAATGRWQYLVINDRDDAIAFGQGFYQDEYRRTADGWRVSASTIYRNYAIELDPGDVTWGRPAAFFVAGPCLEPA
jgi:ketosteroid isomerase-like protein